MRHEKQTLKGDGRRRHGDIKRRHQHETLKGHEQEARKGDT